jgi:CheY-like chemotaxis protein
VLINLLGNAVKFTDVGGVTLRISISESISESTNQSNQSAIRNSQSPILFEVIDTGVGISPEDQKQVFDPFYQGESGQRKGGTGLGLAISQRYLELMGGELEVESPLPPAHDGKEGGLGSRFHFTLPLSAATSTAIAEPSQWRRVRRLASGYQVKALIADDTKVNREVLTRILSELGVEVSEVENGKQAVEAVRRQPPDIVFMDVRMPVMDGLEATQRILAEFDRGQLKIVAISASALRHEQQRYLEAGFDDFIAKPFRLERICECLATLLGVEFERDESDSEEVERPPIEKSEVSLPKPKLPKEVREQLLTAAEAHRVTKLENLLNEVEALGESEQRLAERLRQSIRNYDIEGVIRILSEVEPR